MRFAIVALTALAVSLSQIAYAQGPTSTKGPTPVQVVNTPLEVTGFLGPVKASDLVTLTSSGAFCSAGHPAVRRFDVQNNGDGTTTPFVIPAGQVLVVTGIDFRQGRTDGPGQQEELFLFASSLISDSLSNMADLMAAPGSSDSRAGLSAAITGVIIKSTAIPCWQVNSLNIGTARAVLHGYLAPDL